MKPPSRELYQAIVEAEAATRKAHNLCYEDGGKHGGGFWMSIHLGRAQSILMTYAVKYASAKLKSESGS